MLWYSGTTIALGCYLSASTHIEKNKIFNASIYKPLHTIIVTTVYGLLGRQDNEIIQDCFYCVIKGLKNIKPAKIKAAQHYIYQICRHNIINKCFRDIKKNHILIDDCQGLSNDTYNDILAYDQGNDMNTNEMRNEIIKQLNRLILHKINSTRHLTLLSELKSYIIKNNYDVEGFKEMYMERYNVTSYLFTKTVKECNISVFIFKDK